MDLGRAVRPQVETVHAGELVTQRLQLERGHAGRTRHIAVNGHAQGRVWGV